MAPDIEELIKKVNTLTLDKNRLRQKLAQLSSSSSTTNNQSAFLNSNNNNFTHSNSRENNNIIISHLNQSQASPITSTIQQQLEDSGDTINHRGAGNSKTLTNQLSGDSISSTNSKHYNSKQASNNNNLIFGVECSTTCEEDMLFMNELYRKRLDEYNKNWDFIQSKCTALLSELNALQEHYSILKKEKSDLQEKYDTKCDECDQIKGELQTVVLNYETQLSAMSEHLSDITSQVNLGDPNLARLPQ